METILYECGFGACPKVVYQCGIGACPKVEEDKGIVKIFHPGQPEKGQVEMTKEEWNKLLAEAKKV